MKKVFAVALLLGLAACEKKAEAPAETPAAPAMTDSMSAMPDSMMARDSAHPM